MLKKKEITGENADWWYGQNFVRATEADEWTLDGYPWMRVKVNTIAWAIQSPVRVLAHLGVNTTASRAKEFIESNDSKFDGLYYLESAADGVDGDEVLKWVMGPIAVAMKERDLPSASFSEIVKASYLREFVRLLTTGGFDRQFAKPIFDILMATSQPYSEAETVLAEIGSRPEFKAVSGDEIDGIIDRIISENPDQVAKVKLNPKLIGWFVGGIQKATGGKSNAAIVTEKLRARFL